MNQRSQQNAHDYSNQDHSNSNPRQNRNFQNNQPFNQQHGNQQHGNQQRADAEAQSHSGRSAAQNGRNAGRESSLSNWGSQSGMDQHYSQDDQYGDADRSQYSQQNSAYSQGQNRPSYGQNAERQNQKFGGNPNFQSGRTGLSGSNSAQDLGSHSGEYFGTDYSPNESYSQSFNDANSSSGNQGYSRDFSGSSSQNYGAASRGQNQVSKSNTGQHGNDRSTSTSYGNMMSSNGRSGSNLSERSDFGGNQYSDQSRQSQSFKGLGPKGYKRSDERLQEDIHERLTEAHHIDASEITVRVSEGKVTLEGSVTDRRVKHQIEDLVEACAGVSDIDNRISVARDAAANKQNGTASASSGSNPSANQGSSTSGSQGSSTSGSQGSSMLGSQGNDTNKKK